MDTRKQLTATEQFLHQSQEDRKEIHAFREVLKGAVAGAALGFLFAGRGHR